MARQVKRVSSTRKATKAKSGSSFHSKPATKKPVAAKKGNSKKKGYTAAERRAYWIGVGDSMDYKDRSDLMASLSSKEVQSFKNGEKASRLKPNIFKRKRK